MQNNNMENNNIQNYDAEQEIDLVEIIKDLWSNRKKIIKITAIFIFLGLFVAIFTQKTYTASCVIVPQIGGNSGGSLGSLASMVGINISGSTGGETLSPMVYGNVFNNIELKKELMSTKIKFAEYNTPITLLDYYTNPEYQNTTVLGTIKKYTIGLPFLILGAIIGDPEELVIDESAGGLKLATLTNEEEDCLKILNSTTSLNINDKDGYITISASSIDPYASAQMAEIIKDLMQEYVTKFKIEKAVESLEFISERTQEAKEAFEIKQKEFAQFKDANRSLSSALSRTKEEQIRSDYNIANTLYSELAKQLVQAEIKVKEDTPIFTVVEPVVVPTEGSPSKAMTLIIFAFLGVIVGCGVVVVPPIVKEMFARKEEEQED